MYQLEKPDKIDPSLSVTDICWNCTGNLIAVAYGSIDKVELTFESGYVAVWSVSTREHKPEFVIEVEEVRFLKKINS